MYQNTEVREFGELRRTANRNHIEFLRRTANRNHIEFHTCEERLDMSEEKEAECFSEFVEV